MSRFVPLVSAVVLFLCACGGPFTIAGFYVGNEENEATITETSASGTTQTSTLKSDTESSYEIRDGEIPGTVVVANGCWLPFSPAGASWKLDSQTCKLDQRTQRTSTLINTESSGKLVLEFKDGVLTQSGTNITLELKASFVIESTSGAGTSRTEYKFDKIAFDGEKTARP